MDNAQNAAQAPDASPAPVETAAPKVEPATPTGPAADAPLLVTTPGPVTPPRRPDAIKVPRTFPKGSDIGQRAQHLVGTFKPILGTPKLFWHEQGSFLFLVPNTRQTLLFPFGHPREGQSRYKWMTCTDLPGPMAGHDIEFGYLVDGADPAGETSGTVNLIPPIAERRATYKRLSEQGLLDAKTAAELAAQLDEEEKRANAKAQ